MRYRLEATLTDGFKVRLDGLHRTEAHAQREAENYIRHYSDPCGLGVRVAYVATIDTELEKRAA
jgi:hypothetical protein